jgi:hypothetical protein
MDNPVNPGRPIRSLRPPPEEMSSKLRFALLWKDIEDGYFDEYLGEIAELVVNRLDHTAA